MSRYRGCIFDLDGTLADTLASIAGFVNDTLRVFHFSLIEVSEYRYLVGNGADLLIRRALDRVGAEADEALIKEVRREYDKRYEAEPMKLVAAYPGIPELLAELKAEGLKLGVVSNKPDNMTRYIIRELYGSLLDEVCGQRESVPKKPDPTAVLSMAKNFGMAPEEILYVGDSGVDMDTGRNAGMESCGVLWGFRSREELLEHGAKYLAENTAQLRKIILG